MTEVVTKMVTKRDGSKQAFAVEKIQKRVNSLINGLHQDHMMIPTCIEKVIKYAHSGK